MNEERNKFLTEAMDLVCMPCNFSTWQNFGMLFEWGQKQYWWEYFNNCLYYHNYAEDYPVDHPDVKHDCDHILSHYYINPDKFADALYSFLKEKL